MANDNMELTNKTFAIYALSCYDNQQCALIEEFEEDLKRFLYVKKLLLRYNRNSEELRTHLILNHIIILNNIFGAQMPKLLFFAVDRELWSKAITFLYFLNIVPQNIADYDVNLAEMQLDKTILKELEEL